MKAGKLRHKITVQKVTETLSGFGEPVQTWATFKTLMASVETTGGREFEALAQTHGELSHLIKTRYSSGITSKMRVIFKGRTLQIIAPPSNIGETSRTLKILCQELEA